MKEADYIRVMNLAHLRMARHILADVMLDGKAAKGLTQVHCILDELEQTVASKTDK